ncbi:PHP-associated domain-containing protein [Paenibacillus puerhi]|uniref:PHP-associated domain-containing protein n=1 Tax=Paenibacillus puerhi TaxID=2692622 RepID=UPI00135BA230|nr:PHP-associated domain-containing protein [Paenibacillus puerhi]
MKIDLHAHVKLSKKTPFSLAYFDQSIQDARDAGLDAIAMTEHFNTDHFFHIYEELDRHYPYLDHYYDINGFKVFPGMEVDVDQKGHILVIGDRASILELRQRLEPFTAKGAFIALEKLLDWCDELDLLRIGAHPHRDSNPLTQHPAHLLKRLDALDMNGKDLYSYGLSMRDEVKALAEQIGIPVTAGSDTHHPLQYGCVINRLEHECASYADIRACIRQAQYSMEISDSLPIHVKAATIVKKLLKERGEVLLPPI